MITETGVNMEILLGLPRCVNLSPHEFCFLFMWIWLSSECQRYRIITSKLLNKATLIFILSPFILHPRRVVKIMWNSVLLEVFCAHSHTHTHTQAHADTNQTRRDVSIQLFPLPIQNWYCGFSVSFHINRSVLKILPLVVRISEIVVCWKTQTGS